MPIRGSFSLGGSVAQPLAGFGFAAGFPKMRMHLAMPNLTQKIREMGQLNQRQIEALSETMENGMMLVLRDSDTKRPMVPVDTSSLRSTGHVLPVEKKGTKLRVELSYGGQGIKKFVDYAVAVHEDLGPGAGRKKYTRAGSGPKFVSTHLETRRPEFERNMILALDRAAAQTFKL